MMTPGRRRSTPGELARHANFDKGLNGRGDGARRVHFMDDLAMGSQRSEKYAQIQLGMGSVVVGRY